MLAMENSLIAVSSRSFGGTCSSVFPKATNEKGRKDSIVLRVWVTCGLFFLCNQAQAITGNDLFKDSSERPSAAFNYILGAFEGIMLIQEEFKNSEFKGNGFKSTLICAPEHSTNGQIKDIVIKYLNDHPEERHQPASFLTWRAVWTVWRCKS